MPSTHTGKVRAMSDKSAKTKPPRAKTDWDAMEHDWRAGIKTVLQLSKEHGVSRAGIIKHWGNLGVDRDLAAKIRAKTEALVTQSVVTQEVTQQRAVTEAQIVLQNGAQAAAIRLGHRKDIARLRVIITAQMDELEASSGPEQAQRLRELGDMLREEDENGRDKMNDLYRAIISLPERSKVAKQLAETLRIAIDLERREFGMDKADVADDPLTALIKRINSGAGGSSFRPVAVDPAYSGEGDE